VGAAFVLLLVIGVIVKFIWWLVAGVVAVALMMLAGWLVYRSDRRRALKLGELAAIAARADKQHAQIMAGDDRGIYGKYWPANLDAPKLDEWVLSHQLGVPMIQPRPRPGQTWADYLAETRRKALAD
jgi:hypothetical protein